MSKSTRPVLLTVDQMPEELIYSLLEKGIDPYATPGERNTTAARSVRAMAVKLQNEERLAREQG